MFKRGDIVLIAGIAAIALLLMAWNTFRAGPDRQITAVITRNGSIIRQIDLNDLKKPEYIYLNQGIKQVILAEKGRIRFLKSDCPNKICVKTGWLTKAGDKAVCVPSKVVITVVGDNNKKVDVFSY
jgi:hypothetical protein